MAWRWSFKMFWIDKIFFWRNVKLKTHECIPIVLNKRVFFTRLIQSQNYAAWDRLQKDAAVSECCICNNKFYYDYSEETLIDRIPYHSMKEF